MLYFKGCTAREKQTTIADATEKLLALAGVDYHTLDEKMCCGSFLLRCGFENEARKQIKKNSEILKNEKIITSCAGCYKTLKSDYKNLDVVHISQLLNQLISQNKLHFKKTDLNVTYHDPCHLARHMGVYDKPRYVIEKVANLVEMENNCENTLCCGAGGGVKSAYPELAGKMAEQRLTQALQTDCDVLISTCPFCKLNLENDDLEVLDLCEFLIKYGGLE